MNLLSTAHFIWLGDKLMPSFYSGCLSSFIKKHPRWKITVWTWKDVIPLINESKYKDNFSNTSHFISRYNFVKYSILDRFGGWYVDLDIEWKQSLDSFLFDRCRNQPPPQLIVPVRSYPGIKKVNYHLNDDMLLYAEPGLFSEVLHTAYTRDDYDKTKPYEPVGPVSLSKWLHQTNYTRLYMFEDEIQKQGKYCHHHGGGVVSHF